MQTPYLVHSREAIETLVSLQTETGNRSRFGNPEKFKTMGDRIAELHRTVAENTVRAAALAGDMTRTEVVRHMEAKKLAERVSQAIRTVAQEIKAKAEYLQVRGQEVADEALAPRAGYAALDSEIRGWMREAVKTPEGMAKVSELAKKDATIAAIIYHSPQFLTGLSESLHTKMRLQAVERFAPNAYAMLNEGIELQALAPRYERVVSEIHNAFYSPHLADKGATRVELGD